MKILAHSDWFDSKREVWKEIKEYCDLLINKRQWGYMDEFTMLYLHYEQDLGGTLGYINTSNPYGGVIRRLYLVCTSRTWTDDEIESLKSGEKTIKDFDEDNIL